MKVFISWSGRRSKAAAKALQEFLGALVQQVEFWMSDQDIRSGVRWFEQIGTQLDKSDFGVLCVTASNLESKWMLFEAGALAKSVKKGRVVPLCIDLEPHELTDPLSSFQARKLEREELHRLVRDIYDQAAIKINEGRVETLFNALWDDFFEAISKAKAIDEAAAVHPPRKVDDMVGEVLDRVRDLQRLAELRRGTIEPDATAFEGALKTLDPKREMPDRWKRMAVSAWLVSALRMYDEDRPLFNYDWYKSRTE
ncbi:toll/interleukin-1 receptor domain-containing protein [Kitasatospora sp. NPDC101157]|uniref:toll/interleukin-1 receptor domain-containing protein n=1 Tax=Kitasatospora sp. NPDC101157 TaxID=3364098 RepID=UPI0037F2350E